MSGKKENIPDWKSIGKKLHRRLYSEKGFDLLDSTPASGGSWVAGGCYLLAKAIARITGGSLWCVMDGSRPGCEHVVTSVRGGFLDGDGFSTREDLLRRWKEEEMLGDPRLVPFDELIAREISFFSNEASEVKVAEFIRPAFEDARDDQRECMVTRYGKER